MVIIQFRNISRSKFRLPLTLMPELQKILQWLWAHKFLWNCDQFFFLLIFLDIFESTLHDATTYKSEKYQLLLFFDKSIMWKNISFTRSFSRKKSCEKHVFLIWICQKIIKIAIFHFFECLHRVEWTQKYLEKLIRRNTDRNSIKICELKVTVKVFVIQALMG